MSDQEPRRSPHPLAAEVMRLTREAADAVARLSDPATREQSAAAIRAEGERIGSGIATVVVVGEKKRGKSSLINALVSHPDLLPVEVDVATSVHVVVRHAEELAASAYLEGSDQPVRIPISAITEYAAVDPATQMPHREDVRHVEIGVPSELLGHGLVLVDTPGVGGLVSGHALITLATLRRADALVFVVNGSSELTDSELRFLKQATERIATVLFVLAQTDKYGGWREILDRNQQLIAKHVPSFADAPWLPVSSRAKLDADAGLAAGNTVTATRRFESSGFAPLKEALTDKIAARAETIQIRNALYVTGTAVNSLVAVKERQLRSLNQDPHLAEEVEQRRDRLRVLQTEDAAWRQILAKRMRALEQRLRLDFQRSVNDLRALAEEKISNAGHHDLIAELPGDLEAGVQGIWMELENAAASGVAEVTTEVGQQFGTEELDDLGAELTLPERLRELPALIESKHDRKGPLAGLERAVPVWTAGTLTATVLSTLLGGAVLLPVAAGFGMIALLSGRQKRREALGRARADATKYVNRLITELNTEIPPQITRTMETLSEQLGGLIAERLGQKRAELEAELAQHQRNLEAAEDQLAEQRAHAQVEFDTVTALSRRTADLQARSGA